MILVPSPGPGHFLVAEAVSMGSEVNLAARCWPTAVEEARPGPLAMAGQNAFREGGCGGWARGTCAGLEPAFVPLRKKQPTSKLLSDVIVGSTLELLIDSMVSYVFES